MIIVRRFLIAWPFLFFFRYAFKMKYQNFYNFPLIDLLLLTAMPEVLLWWTSEGSLYSSYCLGRGLGYLWSVKICFPRFAPTTRVGESPTSYRSLEFLFYCFIILIVFNCFNCHHDAFLRWSVTGFVCPSGSYTTWYSAKFLRRLCCLCFHGI